MVSKLVLFSGAISTAPPIIKSNSYTGTGAALVLDSFGLDLVLFRRTDNVAFVQCIDTVRGLDDRTLTLASSDNQDLSPVTWISSTTSSTYTLSTEANINFNTGAFINWVFKQTNRVFSITSYTGNGSAGNTIAHGLNATPEFTIIKNLTTDATDWAVFHSDLNGGTTPEDFVIKINSTAAEANDATYWNDTAPGATNVTLGTNADVNTNTDSYIMYTFASKAGTCDIGGYVGTGASGNKITTNFPVNFVMIKRRDGVGDWFIWDSGRGDNNVITWNISDVETTLNLTLDDDGFTVNATTTGINVLNEDFIYMALN